MSCMDEKIRNRVKSAYDGIVLEEELRQKAKKKIIARVHRQSHKKLSYGIAAAAVVVLLVLGNILLIQLNIGHERDVPAAESTSSGGETESVNNIQVTELDSIETLTELENFAWTPNSCVWEIQNNFYVAILCYDENGAECLPKSNLTANIEYAYFLFDESGGKIKEYRSHFSIENSEWKSIGAVFMNDDWYEVTDSQKDGSAHYYEIINVTSPEKSSYARHPEDEETLYKIQTNTRYFARYAEDGNGYMEVGNLANEYYGQITDFTAVNSRQDLEKLIAQPEVYSIKLLEDMYLVVLPYRQNRRCSLREQADRIDIGCYKTDNDEIAASWVSMREAENSVVEDIGVSNYNGSFYLIGRDRDTERYVITGILWDYEEKLYCDEGICPEVYSNAQFFARLITEPAGLYWQVGEDMRGLTDYSPEFYCENHDWDEKCTSDLTVRDIYVTRNWIGGSAMKFIGLERFFGELVLTDHESGDSYSANSSENAYQINNRFICVNFQVSTEVDSDEIISVTLYGDHNYVTEDVWLGMRMEDVKAAMDIPDSAFFEKDGYIYSFFEKDGYLYEFSYVEESVGSSLPDYASYPAPEYVLSFSRISDAAKIKESTVKSFGELMEEGKSIFAQ